MRGVVGGSGSFLALPVHRRFIELSGKCESLKICWKQTSEKMSSKRTNGEGRYNVTAFDVVVLCSSEWCSLDPAMCRNRHNQHNSVVRLYGG